MSKKFGVSELKEVVAELEKEYDQCQTCWPTTVFSQGSFTERKVYCCSKFVRADGGGKMTVPQEDSGLFSGVRFVLAGFEPAYENQFIEELEENGGVNSGTYDSSCTHVIVSNLAYDDPICAAARKDGKALVTDAWVADCLDNDALADVKNVLYRPLKDLDGIPGSEDLCVCLTGYQGQARQRIMRMVELIGARFTKPLLGNVVTHLICYKFEGEKYELARKTGLKLINHFWLEDCLKSWSLLPEADYARSGWEVEQEAKQSKSIKEKGETARSPVSQKKVSRRTSVTSDVPITCPVDASVNRRDSGQFDNENSNARLISTKVNTGTNSSAPSPSSLQRKKEEQAQYEGEIHRGEITVTQVAQEKVPTPRLTPLVGVSEAGSSFPHSDIFVDALKTADQRDETSPARVKKSRKSSYIGGNQAQTPGSPHRYLCGGENQVLTSPGSLRRSSYGGGNRLSVSPVTREAAVAADHCATIDSSMEQMRICADFSSKRQLGGVDTTELNTSGNTVDFESPESKRRKSSKFKKSELSPSGTKDVLGGKEDVPSSVPIEKHISPSIASASGKLRVKQKLSRNEKETKQDAGSCFGAADAIRGEAPMDMEVGGQFDYLSPRNKHLDSDSQLEAVQSEKMYDAPDVSPSHQNSLANCHVNHTADGASRHVDTNRDKEVSRRTIESSTPRSPRAAVRDVDVEDAGGTPYQVRNSKIVFPKDAKTAPKARRSDENDSAFDVNVDRSAPDEHDSRNDSPAKKPAKKVSRPTLNPPESSRKLVVNNTSRVAAEELHEQNLGVDVMRHELPLESIGVKSLKKSTKVVSSRARDKSAHKTPGVVCSDHRNEEPSEVIRKRAAPESSSAERVTATVTEVPIVRQEKGKRSSEEKDTRADCPVEVHDQNTNEASRHKDAQVKPSNRELYTTTEAQASLGRQEKLGKKKSTSNRNINTDDRNKENVGIQRSGDKDSYMGVVPKQTTKKGARASLLGTVSAQIRRNFAVGGSSDQRNNLHYVIKLLGARVCKSRYEWRDDVTHVILPVPLRRTEKFLAGAAAGRWILKPEYVEASRDAGKFLDEEQYEWFGEGINDKGTISLAAPRKWRTQFATTGCGAFYGLRVLLYGESTSPPSDTIKRAIRAGGGFVLATTPPYSQHLVDGVDFAIINPALVSKDDEHVREFLKHKVACVTSDYFVDYICHPSSSLEKHILYNTNWAAAGAHQRLQKNISQGPTEEVEKSRRLAAQKLSISKPKGMQVADDVACVVCRRTDDEKVMLLCGDDKGRGCGLATHIHCCSPPLCEVPEDDWFCRNCEDL